MKADQLRSSKNNRWRDLQLLKIWYSTFCCNFDTASQWLKARDQSQLQDSLCQLVDPNYCRLLVFDILSFFLANRQQIRKRYSAKMIQEHTDTMTWEWLCANVCQVEFRWDLHRCCLTTGHVVLDPQKPPTHMLHLAHTFSRSQLSCTWAI